MAEAASISLFTRRSRFLPRLLELDVAAIEQDHEQLPHPASRDEE
jgi:hypothetical protein